MSKRGKRGRAANEGAEDTSSIGAANNWLVRVGALIGTVGVVCGALLVVLGKVTAFALTTCNSWSVFCPSHCVGGRVLKSDDHCYLECIDFKLKEESQRATEKDSDRLDACIVRFFPEPKTDKPPENAKPPDSAQPDVPQPNPHPNVSQPRPPTSRVPASDCATAIGTLHGQISSVMRNCRPADSDSGWKMSVKYGQQGNPYVSVTGTDAAEACAAEATRRLGPNVRLAKCRYVGTARSLQIDQ